MDPDLLRTLLIVGVPTGTGLLIGFLLRNNPNMAYNRFKRYDAYEERIKKLETRVALLNRKLKHQAIKYERVLEREKTTKNPPEKL